MYELLELQWSPEEIAWRFESHGLFSISFRQSTVGSARIAAAAVISAGTFGSCPSAAENATAVLTLGVFFGGNATFPSSQPLSVTGRNSITGKRIRSLKRIGTNVSRPSGNAYPAYLGSPSSPTGRPHTPLQRFPGSAVRGPIDSRPKPSSTVPNSIPTRSSRTYFPGSAPFANTHHPGEQDSNESFNGLLREYKPKGHSLDYIGQRKLDAICGSLNYRRRKRLAFRSPPEVLDGLFQPLHLVVKSANS